MVTVNPVPGEHWHGSVTVYCGLEVQESNCLLLAFSTTYPTSLSIIHHSLTWFPLLQLVAAAPYHFPAHLWEQSASSSLLPHILLWWKSAITALSVLPSPGGLHPPLAVFSHAGYTPALISWTHPQPFPSPSEGAQLANIPNPLLALSPIGMCPLEANSSARSTKASFTTSCPWRTTTGSVPRCTVNTGPYSSLSCKNARGNMAMEQIVRKSGKVSFLLPPTAGSLPHILVTSRFGSLMINVAMEMGPTYQPWTTW